MDYGKPRGTQGQSQHLISKAWGACLSPWGWVGGPPLLTTGWPFAAFLGCLPYVLASSPSSQSAACGQLHLAHSLVLHLQLLGVDISQDNGNLVSSAKMRLLHLPKSW